MYNLDEIKKIHIETSSVCNASCPVCNRNIFGGKTNPNFKQINMSLNNFKKYISVKLIKQLEEINFCGNYGDPIITPDFLEICHFLIDNNSSIRININTNAGTRDQNFWESLGKIIKYPSAVLFSVDGLEDTNHIYRRGVVWKKVETAMKSFSKAGGYGIWEFLVFKHNEHQIETAKLMAKEFGISHFTTKKAFGFNVHNNKIFPIIVRNEAGAFEYSILPPSRDEYRNDILIHKEVDVDYIEQQKKFNVVPGPMRTKDELEEVLFNKVKPSVDEIFQARPIKCFAKDRQEIFISSEGLLFPCCFIASKLYTQSDSDFSPNQLQFILKSKGLHNFNLNLKTLEEILDSNLLTEVYEESWNCTSYKNGRLGVCSEFCGYNKSELQSVLSHKK